MIRSAGCGGFGKSPNVPEMRRHIPGSSVCTIFAGKCNEKTMRYDCLFFDLDRTLWDVDRNQKKALRVLYGRYGLDRSGIGFERCFAVFERINAGLWDDYRDGKISRETLRDTRFERMLDEIGLSDRALAQTLADDYLKLAPTFRGLIPYAREVVRELSERYPMYIVTNGFAGVQQIKLRHSGLDGYFRGVVCSEDAGANKPDPRIFEYALDLAGVKAGAAVMIGDDPYSDIPGAERAGIDSIWFDPSGMPCECRPTYRIGSLRELLALLWARAFRREGRRSLPVLRAENLPLISITVGFFVPALRGGRTPTPEVRRSRRFRTDRVAGRVPVFLFPFPG